MVLLFVRNLDEARGVTELLAQNGLARGENGLKAISDVRVALKRNPGGRILNILMVDWFKRPDSVDARFGSRQWFDCRTSLMSVTRR